MMAFFELWRYLKDGRTTLERSDQLRLNPTQLSRLLGDINVREALKNDHVASLLPPVGREVFRTFTVDSLQRIEQQLATDDDEEHRMKDKQGAGKHSSKPTAHLEDGEPLPFFYGDPPLELLYCPIEELDPFYQSHKTFLVLSRGNILHRLNADWSCYLLSPFNGLRTVSIKLLLNHWFQWFILLMLLINCVVMTAETRTLKQIMECIFTAVYSFEVVLKVSSRGFCVGRFTFIRDPWNWLDLLIISTAYPAHFVDLGKLSVLVTIPRVLKIFSVSPGLRRRVEALVQSGWRFVDVLIITVFCLCVLAVIATELFMGLLGNKCVFMPTNLTSHNFTNDSDYMEHVLNAVNHYHLPGQFDPVVCGNASDAFACPPSSTCLRVGKRPNFGYTSYESFGWSLLSMFRLLTQDYWENLLQMTLQAAGGSSVLWFLLLFFPSCFLQLSLILAVVVMVTVDQEKINVGKKKQKEEEFRRIEEVLKKTEKETSSRAVLSQQQSPGTVKQVHEEEGVAVRVADEDDLPPSCCQRLRLWLRPLVMSPFFDLVIILFLIINTVTMATEHYPMRAQHEDMLSVTQLVFTGIFLVEMLLRLLVQGMRGYFQVSWQIFDFVLVVFSIVTFATANVELLSLLRCTHVLRILRLARWWPSLHLFLQILWSSIHSLTLRVLLVLVFLWVVVGMQLFQADYELRVCIISADCTLPRWHMQDLFHTFMVVFRVLCGQWIETMWDCMEVSDPGTCAVYFITFVVFGKLLVVVLFLELFLSSTINHKLTNLEETSNQQELLKRTRTWIQMCWCTEQKDHGNPDHRVAVSNDQKDSISLTAVTSECEHGTEDKTQPCDDKQKVSEENLKENTPEDGCHCCSPLQDLDLSQGSGQVWSTFRRVCLLIVQNRFFEGFMVFVVLLSSIVLVFEDFSLLQHPVLLQVLGWADLVFTLIFLLEMVLKWISFGLKKYFSSFSCWLDFLILDVSLVGLILQNVGISCRPLRAVRTLRIPCRFQGLKEVLWALGVTLPYLVQVLLVVQLVWLLFSILGVNLFAGKFYFCWNETSEEVLSSVEVNNMTECRSLAHTNWINADLHMDHTAMSFMSLLLTATSAGSFSLIYSAMDSRQVQMQPAHEANPYMFLYFVCFIIIGCFFCFHFFIRLLLTRIQHQQHQFGGKHVFMTKEQQIHPQGFRKRFSTKPRNSFPPPQNRYLARLFALVTAPRFEIFMVLVVCLNVVIWGAEAFNDSSQKLEILFWFHFSFVLVFLVEFILKIVALRHFYFSSALNILDFIVLIFTVVGVFIQDLYFFYMRGQSVIVVLRLVRLSRVLQYCSWTRGVRTLLLGFMMSLPALVNIGALLLVLVFTFSVIGMFNFGHVQEAAGINAMFNFRSFWSSLLTMTTVTPTSAWDGLLIPLMASPPDCDPDNEVPGSPVTRDFGSPAGGLVFFASYILLFLLLVVHLFIAVILEVFNAREPENPKDEAPEALKDQHLQMFDETWKKFDPEASQVLQYSELSEFCDALKDPLRIPRPNTIKLINMDLPLLPGDQVHYRDVLRALTVEASQEPISSALQRKHHQVAAGVIQ